MEAFRQSFSQVSNSCGWIDHDDVRALTWPEGKTEKAGTYMIRIGLFGDTHSHLDPQLFHTFKDCDQL